MEQQKIGVTSQPVQEMLNVRHPDYGFLTNTMEFFDGADIPIIVVPGARANHG